MPRASGSRASTTSRAGSRTCSRCSRRRAWSTRSKGSGSSSASPTRCRGASAAGRARRSCSSPTSTSCPIQHCWPGDPAPFVTLPAVITKDPRTGSRNVGMYRMQKIDARSTFMHWQVHKDGAADWRGHGRAARGRGRARAGSRDDVCRERTAAQAHRRADARGVPARRAGRARAREDRRSRGARARRDRARGLHRDAATWRSKARSAITPVTTRRASRSRSSGSRA